MKGVLFAFVVLGALCCPVRVFAAEVPEPEEVAGAVPGEAGELLEGTVLDMDAEATAENLLEAAGEILKEAGRDALGRAGSMVGAALLCAAVKAAFPDAGGKASQTVTLCGVLTVTAIAAGDVGSFLQQGTDTVRTLGDFSKVLLPAMAAAAAAGGQSAAGAAGYSVTVLFLDLLMTLTEQLALPLIYGFTALRFAAAALENPGVLDAAKLVRSVLMLLLTLLMLTFTIFLTVSGAIAAAAGTTATKLTRTAISTALPVVGGIVSDAAAAVVSGAAVMKNALGVFGLFAVCALCLGPVLQLGVNTLLYRAAGALAEAVAEPRLGGLISAMGETLGLLLGIAGSGGIMLFLSITSQVRLSMGG